MLLASSGRGLEIRRAKSLGLFTRSGGTLIRAGFFITVIPICASAQTHEQIAATQAQIAARQAQNNADPAINQGDALQAQLDAISQRDALQAQLEDETLAVRDSLQNQAKTGEAAAAPAASAALAKRDLTVPPAAASPTPSPAQTPAETTPAPEGGPDAAPDGRAATPDKVPEGGSERMQGAPEAVRVQEDESPALRSKTQERHGYRLRPAARPQPQPTFWQRLFGRKETKEAKNAKPGKPRQ